MRQFALLSAALATAMPQQAWARDGATAPFAASRDPAALECLTQAVYYEARNQSDEGQRAVAQVVLNRSRHPNYPNSICGVVFQGSERTTGCQFSFTCDGSMNASIDSRSWARAERIAVAALRGSVYRPVGLALNYHTTAIMPYWAPSLVQQAVVGDHIFYRLPGGGSEALDQLAQPCGSTLGRGHPCQAEGRRSERVAAQHAGGTALWALVDRDDDRRAGVG